MTVLGGELPEGLLIWGETELFPFAEPLLRRLPLTCRLKLATGTVLVLPRLETLLLMPFVKMGKTLVVVVELVLLLSPETLAVVVGSLLRALLSRGVPEGGEVRGLPPEGFLLLPTMLA
jgi:hypothetical protein